MLLHLARRGAAVRFLHHLTPQPSAHNGWRWRGFVTASPNPQSDWKLFVRSALTSLPAEVVDQQLPILMQIAPKEAIEANEEKRTTFLMQRGCCNRAASGNMRCN